MEEKWTKGEDILNRASAGSLLRGTLHIGDMTDANEYTVTRRHLLSAYESPIVRGPILPMKTGEITLTSEQEFVDFERSIENTEIHFGAGLNFNVLGGSLSTGIEKGKTKATESVYIEGYRHVFFSKIRYEIVPIASFQFDQSKLRLSEEAFDSLKEYCWLIWQHGGVGDSDADKYRACANFFEKFGTHVNVGVFHLGGMLTWKSVFSAKTSSKLNEIKSLVSTSLQAHVKAGFSGFEAGGGIEISAKMLKEQFESKTKFNETDISKTKLSCTVYGGPPGAVSTEDWQKGLAADYTTWVIIDRGDLSFHDHVSVWEILRNDPRAYAFYANYSEHPISEDKIFRDSMHPKKRRRVAADALEQFFSTWLYRRKLKYIMNTANRDLTHESYFDALVQIHTENDVRKVKQKPLKQSEWFQFLQEEVNFSGFVLKLPSVKGITVKALKKIWPEIEYLLDIENGPSNKSADKETIMMKNEQFIYSKDIFELVKKFFKIKSGVKQRQSIREILDGTVGLSDPKSYLQQLQEIQDKIKQKTEDTDALKEEYIPEWKDMLRLDDGISKVFLLPEEKKFMDQDILNKIQELTHPLMLTDIHITSGVLDIVDELKERFETRRKFKDSISREIDRGLKEKNGHIYQKVLQTILQEVQLLESVVGDTEDWLKMLEDDWNEESKQSENARVKSEEKPNEKTQEGTQNKNKGMSIEEKPKEMNYKCNGHEQINKGKCIWRLLRMPIESDMELDPQSFEMIVHTVKDLLESASLPCKNRMSDLTDDNEEKRLCISDRTNIFKSMDTALLTDDGSKYLLSLRQILFTVQELKKRTGNRNLWKKILEGDTSMKRFLRKLDPKSPYHVKRIDNETDKETFNVIRELIEDEFEGKNDIFDMIKQQKPTIISKVCSIM